MGDFFDRLRSDTIDGPLRRKFTPAGWATEYAATTPHDDDDFRVYCAALAIHEKLENIRSRLKLMSASSLTATERLRAFVGASNQNFVVTQTKTREAMLKLGEELTRNGQKDFRVEDFLSQIKIRLPGGFDFPPDEAVQSSVDGIEVPIKVALMGSPDLSGNPRMADIEWGDIFLEMNLGVSFRQAEDLWNDCLWNDYEVSSVQEGKIFSPTDIDVKRAYAVGNVRRMTLSAGSTVTATRKHHQIVARGFQPCIRDVVDILRDGKRQVIKVAKVGDSASESHEELFVLRALASEAYYSELLEDPLPELAGVTLSSVLDAWVVISRIAALQLEKVAATHTASMDETIVHRWLPEYIPILQTDALAQALATATDMKLPVARSIVEFFTFRGEKGQDLWSSPLVPIGPKSVAPVFGAIVHPNLRRLVDVWMRRGGLKLEDRGPEFEQYLRAKTYQKITSSTILNDVSTSIREDYKFFPRTGRSEQIDLLFVIGSTVFVGEAKCILEPTDAKSLSLHRRTVRGAAAQALRKAQSVDSNRVDFVNDVRRFDMELPADFTVIPLVIVSTSTHVGIVADGVPVIDQYILLKFLEGKLEHAGVSGPGHLLQQRTKDVFYGDAREAEAIAGDYFTSPPQTRRLVESIHERLVPLHPVGENDWGGFIVTLECRTGEDEVDEEEGGLEEANQ